MTDRAMAIVKMLTGNKVHLGTGESHGHVKLGCEISQHFHEDKNAESLLTHGDKNVKLGHKIKWNGYFSHAY